MLDQPCAHCGELIPKPANSAPRTYCGRQCAYDHRRELRMERRAVSRATHEANVAGEARFQAERRKRQARLERMTA